MKIAFRCSFTLLLFALALFCVNIAVAEMPVPTSNPALINGPDDLPANAGLHVKHTNNSNAGGLHGKGNIPTPHGFPEGVDTLVNFTGHFESDGIYFDGSAHHIWE